jgi:hypothetical protein
MKSAKAVAMKNGKPATQGVCPTCGTKMFRIEGGLQAELNQVETKVLTVNRAAALVNLSERQV